MSSQRLIHSYRFQSVLIGVRSCSLTVLTLLTCPLFLNHS